VDRLLTVIVLLLVRRKHTLDIDAFVDLKG
jgi:hypothetical protein